MKRITKLLCVLLCACVVCLAGCATKTDGGLAQPYDKELGKNPEKTLNTIGSWTKTGIVNHWHSGTDAGPMIMYGVEGLVQYVRTTDTYYYLLAESVVNNDDGTTDINLRENANWHDGTPFTADDVIAYYAIDYQNDVCKYFSKLEKVTDKKVRVTWKSYREPTNEAKLMLIAVDTKLASVQYKEFKTYVDRALAVINDIPEVTEADLAEDYQKNVAHPYGRMWDAAASSSMGEILNELRAYQPSWYVATGPYLLEKYTETEMILKKNPDYYLDNSAAFDYIKAYQTPNNTNQTYSMLSNGTVDYFDGCPLPEIIDNVLGQNPGMVHYKMIDQNSCGLFFNLEKEIWSDRKVREAFQYLFDRDMVRQLSQPYGTTSYYPMLTVTQAQAEYWMKPEDFAKLPRYSYDQGKAEKLLGEAGWSKKGGSWYDSAGKKLNLTLGVENNNLFLNMAQAVQSTLNSFGISTTIKVGENWNTWFATGRQANSPYDFVVGVTDANSYTTHPYGFMRHFFDVLDAHMLHLPVSDITGRWDVSLERPDGRGSVELVDEMDKLYLVTGDALATAVGNIVYGFSQHLYGLQFFENVTGSFFNADRVWGLPALEELAKDGRNIAYIPKAQDPYFKEIADLNSYYTQGSVYGLGKLYPRA